MEEIKNLKILLAEDNKINQRIASLTFDRMGISIDLASNGQEAVDKYRQKAYDLILMDLQMPVMDGMEAARQIRGFELKTQSVQRVYIVALTAHINAEIKEECTKAGMDGFIEKPFRENDLQRLWSKKATDSIP